MTHCADPHADPASNPLVPAALPTPADDAAVLPEKLQQKLAALQRIIGDYGSALIAFSGGVDSALVLAVAAQQLGPSAVALTAVSETMAEREVTAAAEFARYLGVRHEIVHSRELDRPGFAQNPVDRCYHCKAELLTHCAPVAERLGIKTVLLGVNLDDLGDHRPGLVAAREHGAKQPLVEAELTKAEVRQLARHLRLPVWNKPQLACLSSRFPYGTSISPARLRMVDRFEQGLQDLGFTQLRVRFHELPALGESAAPAKKPGSAAALARVELEPHELERGLRLQREIVALGKQAGFVYVTLDLEGFRSGSANIVLRRLPIVSPASTTAPAVGTAKAPAVSGTSAHAASAAAASPSAAATPAEHPPAAAVSTPAIAAAAAASVPAAVAQSGSRSRKLVVAGLLRERPGGAVLLSQRRADQAMPLQWELPGGKVEPGEDPAVALRRELHEELDIDAQIGEVYDVVFHRYAEFDLLMLVYVCTFSGVPAAREVAQVRWVAPAQLLDMPVLPADIPLMQRLMREAA